MRKVAQGDITIRGIITIFYNLIQSEALFKVVSFNIYELIKVPTKLKVIVTLQLHASYFNNFNNIPQQQSLTINRYNYLKC